MKYISRLIAILTIAIALNTYCAEEKPASSYWSSAWSYVSGAWKSLSAWAYSWIEDKRTPSQIAADNDANEIAFDNEVEGADALITHAEELHQKISELKPLNDENKQKIKRYIDTLEARRIDLSLLQARLSPNYVKEVTDGIVANFKHVKNFSPLDVYPFLARQFEKQGIIKIEPITATKGMSFTKEEKAKKIDPVKQAGETIRTTFSAQKIARQINVLIKDLEKQKSESAKNDLSLLRQTLFLFQNNKAKEQFDAFLLDGIEGGLNSLKITDNDASKMNKVNDLMGRLQMIKAELQNDLR